MLQISFQAALDPFHAMFRILRMRSVYSIVGSISVDHARIIDFYMAFPFKISEIRLQQKHRRFRRLGESYRNYRPYGEQPDNASLFARMGPMQIAAMETLVSTDYLDSERLRSFWITPTNKNIPGMLQSRLKEVNGKEADLIEFMLVLASEYTVSGRDGLKGRTGLMDFRYDVV